MGLVAKHLEVVPIEAGETANRPPIDRQEPQQGVQVVVEVLDRTREARWL